MIQKAILFFSFALIIQNAYSQVNTDRVLTIGRNALYFEDYVLSIQYFNQVIRSKPWIAEPYFYRAVAKLSLDDFQGAEDDCSYCIARNPFYTQAYYARGIARQSMEKYDEAISDYKRGLELRPNDRPMMTNMAIAYLQNKNYDASENAFNELMEQTLQLTILVHQDCNFRCTYCYEEFQNSAISNEMINSIIKFIDKQLQTNKFKYVFINYFGGEPLLAQRQIETISKRTSEITKKHNVQLEQSITTNGYLLTNEVQQWILDLKIDNFQITIDGICKTHNLQRVLKNGEGTYEKIFSNLLQLKQKDNDYQVLLRMNVGKQNFQFVDDFVKSIKTNFENDKRFETTFCNINYWSKNNTEDLCNENITLHCLNVAKNLGVPFMSLFCTLSPSSICYAGKPNAFVFGVDGKVYKCTVGLYDNCNEVGCLKDDKIDIDNDKHLLWLKNQYEQPVKKCSKCSVMPICVGNSCPYANIKAEKRVCPSYRENINEYIELLYEQNDAHWTIEG
jgi:uncharacterized protein